VLGVDQVEAIDFSLQEALARMLTREWPYPTGLVMTTANPRGVAPVLLERCDVVLLRTTADVRDCLPRRLSDERMTYACHQRPGQAILMPHRGDIVDFVVANIMQDTAKRPERVVIERVNTLPLGRRPATWNSH
jgi:hypothetical protein